MKKCLLVLISLLLYAVTSVGSQVTIEDEEELVDPLGYPFTAMDYLRVFDSFLGGLGAFEYVPESRDCIANLQDKLDQLNYTFMAWDPMNI